MDRKTYIKFTIIQILILIEVYLADFLSKRKMGVMRHLVYMNQKLYPFIHSNAKNIFLGFTIVLFITILREKIKSRLKIETIIVLISTLVYILLFRDSKEASYNITLLSLLIFNFITILKYFILV